MTVSEIANRLNGKVKNDAGKDALAFYAGDFLSRVMGKAPEKSCWLTVMNNVNVAGVATLADVSVVVLCEGVTPDERLVEKCAQENVSLVLTDMDVFSSAVALSK